PNHLFTLTNALHQELTAYYFANDSIFKQAVINTINFTADLSDIYGTGYAYFDPNQDSILIAGLDWDGLGTYISGNRRLTEVVNPPKRFKTTLTIRGFSGDSTKWKFRVFPEAKFRNTGWELGEDRWFKYLNNGDTITLPEFKPNIESIFSWPITVLFTCNMNSAPKNRYNGESIPVNQINFIGLKGSHHELGGWYGDWKVSDTTASHQSMLVLNDNGYAGDVVAGDGIWSTLVVFQGISPEYFIGFKYACMYPGADTVNGGVAPLDNEASSGQYHTIEEAHPSPITIVTSQVWGLMVGTISDDNSAVVSAFSLGQNYPNPFNPSTNFTYTIPMDGNVSLKVYNAMGEEVAVVFNGFQHAGKWNATINGYGLSSGVYFYTLRAGNYCATRKMVLLK
ncbi:MAG: T9SS type A sorting domain-containing protein, partial [Ignavibacteriales bacterium]|nr:T9SS type A sorting domain-containing protein [Ignavibacteriales bacterium]